MCIVLDENLRAKITNFGLSKVKTRNQTIIGVTNFVLGSPNWKVPETYDENNCIQRKLIFILFESFLWSL